MKITICGTIFGTSGYDIHTRGLANGLFEINPETRLNVPLVNGWQLQCNDAELSMINSNIKIEESTMIMIAQPHFWRLGLAENPKNFIGFLVWEGDSVPSYWKEFILDEKVSIVFVPSEHTKKAVLNKIPEAENKIRIIHHGYNSKIFYTDKKPHEKFTFFANKGWAQGIYDRGGMQWLFKSFSDEFKKEEPVILKAKINTVYNAPNWNVNNEMLKLELKKDSAPIVLITESMKFDRLRELYNEADVFVSTTMADGFNLPCLEALACGIPVLTTCFGGQTDFVNVDNGWIIEKGEYIQWGKEVNYEAVKWFKPDLAEIRAKLREIYENKEIVAKKASNAALSVKNWTWKDTASKVMKALS